LHARSQFVTTDAGVQSFIAGALSGMFVVEPGEESVRRGFALGSDVVAALVRE